MMRMRAVTSLMLAIMLFVLPLSVFADDFVTPVEMWNGEEMVWDPASGEYVSTVAEVDNIAIEITPANNQETTALIVWADTVDSSITVDGDVSKVDNSCGDFDRTAVVECSDEGFTASATINGNVTSNMSVEDDGHTIAENDAVLLDSWGEDGSTTIIDVKGSVSSESSALGSGADANARAIHTVNNDCGEGFIYATVGKDAVAKATADDDAYADSIYVYGFGTNDVHVKGNVIAEAKSNNGNAHATGVSLYPYYVGDTTITVDKNVEVSAESSIGVKAIGILANSNTGTANIHVKGDVESEIKADNFGANFDNMAIEAFTENGASVTVTVDGKAMARASNQYGAKQAVHASADGEKSLTDITLGGTEGSVDISSVNGGTMKMTVKDGIKAVDSAAVEAHNSEGNMDLTVNGDVVSTGVGYGILSQTTGANAVTNINLYGDVSAESPFGGYGLLLTVADQGKVKAAIMGDSVSSKATGSYDDTYASGMIISNAGGDIELESVADFSATGAVVNSGLNLNSSGEDVYSVDKSSAPVEIEPTNADVIDTRLVDGVKTEVCWFGDVGYVAAGDGTYNRITCSQVFEEGSTKISITGNVTGDQYGLDLDVRKEQTADIIVDGTIEGQKCAVLVGEETDIGDKVKLTVWEIVPNENQDLICTSGAAGSLSSNKAAEKEIQYIIKIEPTQTDIISTQGTTTYEGYQVAHENDVVTLKLNIPVGYDLAAVYGDVGMRLDLLRDANGDYYLNVPRGGGVLLSVKLVKREEANRESKTSEAKVQKAETITNNTVNSQIQKDQQTVRLDIMTNTVIINMRIFKSLNLLTSTLESFRVRGEIENPVRMVRFETEYGYFEFGLEALLLKIGEARLAKFKVEEYNKLHIYADNELFLTLIMDNYYK